MDCEMMEWRACCFIPNEVLVKHCKNCLDYFEEMDWNGMIFSIVIRDSLVILL